jgi:hypothetical protein
MFMGNAFIVATYYYNVIHGQHELYLIYITGFAGFILSFLLFFFGKKKLPKFKTLTLAVITLLISSYVFVIPYDAMFFVAVGITTFAYALMIPYINVLNNQIGKTIQKDIGSAMVYAIFLLTIFQSAARFAGPAAFAIFTHTITDQDCNFEDKHHYVTIGCIINGYIGQNISYISVSLVLSFIALIFLHIQLKKLGIK